MAKLPAGQKKTKEAIAKAAQSKKGGKKKWTKGKAKEKSNNAVFIERKNLDNILTNPNKIGKVITVSTFVEKQKVNGSLARSLLRIMHEKKLVIKLAKNGNQWVYTSAQAAVAPAVTEKAPAAAKTQKGAKAPKA